MSNELIAGIGGAIIGAILAALFAWRLQRPERIASKKEELRNTLIALVDLREHYQTEVPKIQNPQLKESAGLFINQKMTIYLQTAEALVDQVPKHIFSFEYGTLAYEFWLNSSFTQAEKFYRNAVKVSCSTLAKVTSLRGLGSYYFGQGPHHDFDNGRRCFQEATDLIKNPTDDYSKYTLGYTYQLWGLAERSNGFVAEGEQKIDRARKYYEDLSFDNPLREQALEWLEVKVQPPGGIDSGYQDPNVTQT